MGDFEIIVVDGCREGVRTKQRDRVFLFFFFTGLPSGGRSSFRDGASRVVICVLFVLFSRKKIFVVVAIFLFDNKVYPHAPPHFATFFSAFVRPSRQHFIKLTLIQIAFRPLLSHLPLRYLSQSTS